jgi:multicomponent Na+:H+ antiporter subunit E
MIEPAGSVGVRSALFRWAALFGLWILLAVQTPPSSAAALASDLAVGLFAASMAAWASLRLLPTRHGGRLRWGALLRLVARFLWQSVVAGIDVSRRAFDPRLPLRPGFVAYKAQTSPGTTRAVFGALTSLIPGTLSVGTGADGSMVYHCLDKSQPIAAGLARDEALLLRLRGKGRKNG